MSEMTTEKLKEYLIQVGDRLKPSSLGHRVPCIKSLLKWKHEEGYISKKPAAKLKEPKLGKRIPKFLSELERTSKRGLSYNDGECTVWVYFLL